MSREDWKFVSCETCPARAPMERPRGPAADFAIPYGWVGVTVEDTFGKAHIDWDLCENCRKILHEFMMKMRSDRLDQGKA